MTILKNLRLLRNEYGISQQKLGDEIEVSQPSINKYENHDIEPDITTLKRLADYFETSIDYIVGHTQIRRKIEELSAHDLNEREAALVKGYRLIPASGRKVIDDMITEMLKK